MFQLAAYDIFYNCGQWNIIGGKLLNIWGHFSNFFSVKIQIPHSLIQQIVLVTVSHWTDYCDMIDDCLFKIVGMCSWSQAKFNSALTTSGL